MVPTPADGRLAALVTDLSGLPATAHIIEQLPDGYRATAIVEVADAEDLDYLPRLTA